MLRLPIRHFCYSEWTALTMTTNTPIPNHMTIKGALTPLLPYINTSASLSIISFGINTSFHLDEVPSDDFAKMCVQYVCHFCDQHLEDDNSLVPCFAHSLAPAWLSGSHKDCPYYIQSHASASNLCNFCLDFYAVAAESFLRPTDTMSNYTK